MDKTHEDHHDHHHYLAAKMFALTMVTLGVYVAGVLLFVL